MKKIHNYNAILIAFAVFVLDQVLKIVFESFLEIGQSFPIIKNVFHFTLVHNFGAGFGLMQGGKWFFIVFSIIVLIGIMVKWNKIPSTNGYSIPLGLIIGGILGNLFDRIFLSYVIDFIDLRIWPVFNIADSALTIAVVFLIIYMWKK